MVADFETFSSAVILLVRLGSERCQVAAHVWRNLFFRFDGLLQSQC